MTINMTSKAKEAGDVMAKLKLLTEIEHRLEEINKFDPRAT